MFADLVIQNGRLFTVDAQRPWAEAVACRDGVIRAVGTAAEIAPLIGPQTTVIDAGGRLVLPAFTDAHIHFLAYAQRRRQLALFGERDLDRLLARVAAAAAQTPPGEWILGWGWDENLWDRSPLAADLDRVAPHHLVALARMDMHTWWVNGRALTLAGIDAQTPDPPESKIERDADGRPTGLLREWNAIALVEEQIPAPDEPALVQWAVETIAHLHQLGIAAIHDLRVEREGAQSLRVFQALRARGQLDLRVHFQIAADFLPEAAALGLRPGFGDDRLWLGHVKAFADGTMGSHTAWMLEPFRDQPRNSGLVVTPPEELWQLAQRAGEAGFSMAVHAIGDRAVREVIDVFSEYGATTGGQQLSLPQRIEHVQLIHPDDLSRLAAAGIAASMQPVHLRTDWPTADAVWGERARLAYAFQSLLAQETLLAFGSDAPVAPVNPMLGIHAALTRQDEQQQPAGGWYPAEKMALADIIRAYTLGPAIVAGKQAVQGSLTAGKWADIIILEQDLFAIPAAAVETAQVNTTIVAGKVVFTRS